MTDNLESESYLTQVRKAFRVHQTGKIEPADGEFHPQG
jgi:hypothetical protein